MRTANFDCGAGLSAVRLEIITIRHDGQVYDSIRWRLLDGVGPVDNRPSTNKDGGSIHLCPTDEFTVRTMLANLNHDSNYNFKLELGQIIAISLKNFLHDSPRPLG